MLLPLKVRTYVTPVKPFCPNSTIDYDAFANALREIDAKEEVIVTLWQGRVTGNFQHEFVIDL